MKLFGKVFVVIIVLSFLLMTFSLCVNAATTHKVSYHRGYEVVLDGKIPDWWILGDLPSSVTVSDGGSVTASENTLTFRDYYFDGWRYSTTDSDGDRVYHKVQPGEVIENITENLVLYAIWKREPIKLKITCPVSFDAGTGINIQGTAPETIKADKDSVITLPESSFTSAEDTFHGWLGKDGRVYQPGDSYTVSRFNEVFTAVWNNTDTSNIGSDVSSEVSTDVSDSTESQPSQDISTVKHTVNVTYNYGGSVTPEGIQYVDDGDSLTITIAPFTGYVLYSLKVNGEERNGGSTFTLENVYADTLIEVEFEPDENAVRYKFTFEAEHGTVLFDEGDTVLENGSKYIMFSADTGYMLSEVYINGVKVEADLKDAGMTVSDVTENKHIKAVFVPKESNEKSGIPQPAKIILLIVSLSAVAALLIVTVKSKSR